MKIVELPNGNYALRRWWLFGYEYAGRRELLQHEKIIWWPAEYPHNFQFNSYDDLNTAVKNYNYKKSSPKGDVVLNEVRFIKERITKGG